MESAQGFVIGDYGQVHGNTQKKRTWRTNVLTNKLSWLL